MKKLVKINFVKFMQGLTLLILSILLVVVFTVLSFIYTIFYTAFTLKFQTGINNFGSYMSKMALALDQFGNVSCSTLLQITLSKKGGFKFGDEDDTVSYILGRLKYQKKLTIFGKLMVLILHLIERNHVELAIESKIERDQEAVMRIQKMEYYG